MCYYYEWSSRETVKFNLPIVEILHVTISLAQICLCLHYVTIIIFIDNLRAVGQHYI
jgi:hypothetical protein